MTAGAAVTTRLETRRRAGQRARLVATRCRRSVTLRGTLLLTCDGTAKREAGQRFDALVPLFRGVVWNAGTVSLRVSPRPFIRDATGRPAAGAVSFETV